MSLLREAWAKLETDGESGGGFVRLRVPSELPCAVYAAREVASGLETVILEVDTAALPSRVRYPISVGFEVCAEPLTPGRHGLSRIRLSLTAERFRDVFLTLAQDVWRSLGSASNSSEAITELVAQLSRWQNFLRRHGAEGLPLERRRGLYGELIFLHSWLLPRLDPIHTVEGWAGPRGANQDFQLASGAVEVKTTSASIPHLIYVANAAQLDPSGLQALYVLLVHVEESDGAKQSLPELVETIQDSMDETSRPLFEELLIEVGYLQTQAELYRTPKYSLCGTRFFEVRSDFPRVVAEDLPEGIADVSYSIAVASCADFECDGSAVVGQITGEVDGSDR